MKVLFHAYNCCCQNESGGVQVRIRRMQKLLSSKGVQVDFFNPYETKLKDYDILHVFMLTIESQELVKLAKSLGLKVVLSSIVSIREGFFIDFYRSLPRQITTDVMRKYNLLKKFDAIIAETPAEADFLHKHYKVPCAKMKIIPNGVDELGSGGDEIFGLIGGKKKYALMVGRFDENKNQLNVIKALRDTEYNVVFVGGPNAAENTKYYDTCVSEANGSPRMHFLGWLPAGSSALNSAYRNAHAVIVASHHETFGLVATEGAMAGAHVCLSKTLAINGFNVFKKEHTFNPDSIKDIRIVVDNAMKTPKDSNLKNKAIEVFSWDMIAQQHIDIYNKL